MTIDEILKCPRCKEDTYYSRGCGCYVCQECGAHFHVNQNIARCYCGFRGEDWRKPERPRHWEDNIPLDDDIGIAVYDGEGFWDVDY